MKSYVDGLKHAASLIYERAQASHDTAVCAALFDVSSMLYDVADREAATPETPARVAIPFGTGSEPATVAETPDPGKRCERCYGTGEVGKAIKDPKGRQIGNEKVRCPACAGTGLRDGGRAETREEGEKPRVESASELCARLGWPEPSPERKEANLRHNLAAPPSSPEPVPTPDPTPEDIAAARKRIHDNVSQRRALRCDKPLEHTALHSFPCNKEAVALARAVAFARSAGKPPEPAPTPVAAPTPRERMRAVLAPCLHPGEVIHDANCPQLLDRLTANEQAWQERVDRVTRMFGEMHSERDAALAAMERVADLGNKQAGISDDLRSRLDTAVKLLRDAVDGESAIVDAAKNGPFAAYIHGWIVYVHAFLAEYDKQGKL